MPDHGQPNRRTVPPDYQFSLKRSMTEPSWNQEGSHRDQGIPDRTPRGPSRDTGARASRAAIPLGDDMGDQQLHAFGSVDPGDLVDSSSATELPPNARAKRNKKRPERRRQSIYLDDEDKDDKMTGTTRQVKHSSQHAMSKDDQIQQLRDQVRSLEKKLEKREKNYKKLEKNLSDLVQENETLDTQLNDQDTQIRVIQNHQLQRTGTHNFLNLDDDKAIRRKMKLLMTKCSSWARDNALRRLSLETRDVEKILSEFAIPTALLSAKYSSVAPSIVLNTILVRNITDWIFRKPFIGVIQAFDYDGELRRSNDSEIFDEYYRILLEENKEYRDLAHSWRSITIELLDPPEHESTSRPDIYDGSLDKRERYYRSATKLFTRRHGFLCRQQLPEIDEQLLDIMRSAGELFSTLWRRKIYVECRLENYLWKQFYVASDELEAHPTEQLVEGATRKDGQYVQLVVQPAIVIYGDDEGKHHDQSRILVKAVVWLGDGEVQ